MKNIELTEDHKSKLLKMCKELFPEYVEIDFNKSGLLTLWKEKCPSIQWSEIHWFEFCTKIGHKIFSRKQFYYQSEEFITFMKIMCLQDKSKLKHPIDYLYEKFKNL